MIKKTLVTLFGAIFVVCCSHTVVFASKCHKAVLKTTEYPSVEWEKRSSNEWAAKVQSRCSSIHNDRLCGMYGGESKSRGEFNCLFEKKPRALTSRCIVTESVINETVDLDSSILGFVIPQSVKDFVTNNDLDGAKYRERTVLIGFNGNDDDKKPACVCRAGKDNKEPVVTYLVIDQEEEIEFKRNELVWGEGRLIESVNDWGDLGDQVCESSSSGSADGSSTNGGW